MARLNRRISRRAALAGAAGAGASAALACALGQADASESSRKAARFVIWDAHGHLSGVSGTPQERMAQLLEYADRVAIERLIVFMGHPWDRDPDPDEVRRQNDQVLEAIGGSRGRALGFVYLNPKHTEASLQELDRCVRDGPMVGIKLWVALRCRDRRLDAIVRRAVELKAPVLQHTWYKAGGNGPGESTPADLVELALRHPDASFIAAHVGGDWELGVRAVRRAKNIVAEVCGSDPTAGMVEMAVRELGAERVVYGSDFGGRSFASQLAKVHGAQIPDAAKQLAFAGNIRRLLQPILDAKGAAG
jgi:hypothetical protein